MRMLKIIFEASECIEQVFFVRKQRAVFLDRMRPNKCVPIFAQFSITLQFMRQRIYYK